VGRWSRGWRWYCERLGGASASAFRSGVGRGAGRGPFGTEGSERGRSSWHWFVIRRRLGKGGPVCGRCASAYGPTSVDRGTPRAGGPLRGRYASANRPTPSRGTGERDAGRFERHMDVENDPHLPPRIRDGWSTTIVLKVTRIPRAPAEDRPTREPPRHTLLIAEQTTPALRPAHARNAQADAPRRRSQYQAGPATSAPRRQSQAVRYPAKSDAAGAANDASLRRPATPTTTANYPFSAPPATSASTTTPSTTRYTTNTVTGWRAKYFRNHAIDA
jgi:hypothetical protein